MGLLIVGLMTVAGVLVYRVTRDDGGGAATQYSLPALRLPVGSEVISASAAGGLLTLTYRAGPVTSIRIFDGRTGDMLREVPIVSE